MKKLFKILCVCAVSLCALLTACSGKSTLLGSPASPATLDYKDKTDVNFADFRRSADGFASRLVPAVYDGESDGRNFVISPVSAYTALSLAAACSSGSTRNQLVDALGTTYEDLQTYMPKLYSLLNEEYRGGVANKVTGSVKLSNSIWINENIPVNSSCIDTLSEKFCAYSYHADFTGDNKNANRAVRNFVKEQTNGLIDMDFNLDESTNFTLISALYLKDIWNEYGNNLSFTDEEYDFTCSDGSQKPIKLLKSYYSLGRIFDSETFSAYYASTLHGFKITFIVPKDGYTVRDVFNAENISATGESGNFNPYDDENMLEYHTRCLFPEFSASYNGELSEALKAMGITDLFSSDCDFSALTDEPTYCTGVIHSSTLTVDKRGIEGAAVTVITGEGAAGPGEYTEVYEDFVVDRAFGFILTDSYGVNLFSGVINNV